MIIRRQTGGGSLLSKKALEIADLFDLKLLSDMSVGLEREAYVSMTKQRRKSFHVHPALETASCKSVSQTVYIDHSYAILHKYLFVISLEISGINECTG